MQNLHIAVNRIFFRVLGFLLLVGVIVGAIWLSDVMVNWLWPLQSTTIPRPAVIPFPNSVELQAWLTFSLISLLLIGIFIGGFAELILIGNSVPFLLMRYGAYPLFGVVASLLAEGLTLVASCIWTGEPNLWGVGIAIFTSLVSIGVLFIALPRRNDNEKHLFKLNAWQRMLMALPLIGFIGLLVGLVNANLELEGFQQVFLGVMAGVPYDTAVQYSNPIVIACGISAGLLFEMALQPFRRNQNL